MTAKKKQEQPLTDSELIDLSIRFVLAMLRSADTDVIGPKRWWERAKTSLETSASQAESWPQMVSKAGAKLQILAPLAVTAKEISSIGSKLSDEITFERFRHLCQRDALYIVAMARANKEAARNAKN